VRSSNRTRPQPLGSKEPVHEGGAGLYRETQTTEDETPFAPAGRQARARSWPRTWGQTTNPPPLQRAILPSKFQSMVAV